METVGETAGIFAQKKLRENHSGIETMERPLRKFPWPWLRENHSGMETSIILVKGSYVA